MLPACKAVLILPGVSVDLTSWGHSSPQDSSHFRHQLQAVISQTTYFSDQLATDLAVFTTLLGSIICWNTQNLATCYTYDNSFIIKDTSQGQPMKRHTEWGLEGPKRETYGLRTHHPPGMLVYGYQPRRFIVECPSIEVCQFFSWLNLGYGSFGKATKASAILIASCPYGLWLLILILIICLR